MTEQSVMSHLQSFGFHRITRLTDTEKENHLFLIRAPYNSVLTVSIKQSDIDNAKNLKMLCAEKVKESIDYFNSPDYFQERMSDILSRNLENPEEELNNWNEDAVYLQQIKTKLKHIH